MSAARAFTAMTHRPVSRDLDSTEHVDGTEYIDEPCSRSSAHQARVSRDVSGSGQSDNVIFVNFPRPCTTSIVASPVGTTQTRLRLTRRGRRVIALLVALPIVIAGFAFALNGGGAIATGTSSTNTYSYVTVAAGESLWRLANALAPTADPRDVIAQIVALNQITGDIQPGQRLAIPSGY